MSRGAAKEGFSGGFPFQVLQPVGISIRKGKVGEDGDEKGKANAPSPQHSLHHSLGHCFACDFFLAETECILATTGHGFQSAPRAHR